MSNRKIAEDAWDYCRNFCTMVNSDANADENEAAKADYLSQFDTADTGDGWVSVEQPPEESGRYWCYIEEINDLGISHYQWNCYYDKEENKWREKTMGAGDRVTHWQPLAAPPKQQAEEEKTQK